MKVTGTWDGASRAPLRVVLALLVCFDAMLTAWFVATSPASTLSHPQAPRALLALGGHWPGALAVAAIAVAAAAQFARRSGAILAALVALVAVGVLVEAHAALIDGPQRFLFFTGAVLLGWTAGLCFARWEGIDARTPEGAHRSEVLAEQGAVSALAACYVGAFVSKLLGSGVHWADAGALQVTIAAQHAWGTSSALDALANAALEHPIIPLTLAGLTLIAQASAAFMPFSRRGRVVSSVLLLAFHTGVWLLTPISFPQSMVLLVAFGFPWPRLFSRLRVSIDDHVPASGRSHALKRLAVVIGAMVLIAASPPVRAYTALQHHRGGNTDGNPGGHEPAPPPLSEAARALLGDVSVGGSFRGFRVERIAEPQAGVVRIELSRSDEMMMIEVVAHGRMPHAAQVKTARFDLFNGSPPPDKKPVDDAEQLSVLRALAADIGPRETLPAVSPLLQ